MILRPYQRACVDAVFRWVTEHDGHALAVVPTAGGKSLIMGTLINEALANYPAGRALVLAHRKELIAQNVRAITTVMPLGQIGIYSAGLRSRDTTSRVIVAGIQSMAKQPYALGAFDLILIDECHLLPPGDDGMYRAVIKAMLALNPHVRFIGLTATPYRLSTGLLHRGRGALFTDIAYECRIPELIADGYLCPLRSRGTEAKLSTEGVATRGGEFVPGQLEKAVDTDNTNGAVVAEMIRLLEGRAKWLIFCAGVQHAEHVAALLRASGVAAEPVHGELDAETRAHRLAAFRDGRLRALTSMDVLTTGYDEPAIDAIVLLRPTKSTGLYIQMVGRAFRLHPSKADSLILDFAGNVARHGPVDQVTVREDRAPREGDAPTKECPECHTIVFAGARLCSCGHAFPPPKPAPIVPEATTLPILSTAPAQWQDVTEVQYFRHQKEGGRPSLRVEYYNGWHRVASEWVCLEHDGFARQRAHAWWSARSPEATIPATVAQALDLVDDLLCPVAIATKPDGRWQRIVEYRFAHQVATSGLPRACWSCAHWNARDTCCRHWKAVPPADVQRDGCEAWADDDVAELAF